MRRAHSGTITFEAKKTIRCCLHLEEGAVDRSLVFDRSGRKRKQTLCLAACLYHPATILSKELLPGSCSSTHRPFSATHRPSSLLCSMHLNSTIHTSPRLLALHVALVADSLEGCRRRSRAPGRLLAARPAYNSSSLCCVDCRMPTVGMQTSISVPF